MTAYGGFWLRFVAYIIDAIILNIGSFIIGLIFGGGLGATMASSGASPDQIIQTARLGGWLLGLLLGWLYYALMESSDRQATVGKIALGMIVTDLDGRRISFGQATGRFFGKIVSTIILLIGFIMVAFTERKQGLHDLMAGTLVIKGTPGSIDLQNASVFE